MNEYNSRICEVIKDVLQVRRGGGESTEEEGEEGDVTLVIGVSYNRHKDRLSNTIMIVASLIVKGHSSIV